MSEMGSTQGAEFAGVHVPRCNDQCGPDGHYMISTPAPDAPTPAELPPALDSSGASAAASAGVGSNADIAQEVDRG